MRDSFIALILVLYTVGGFVVVNNSVNRQNNNICPKQEATVVQETKDYLTVEDLKAIYDCVDVKIENSSRDVKFPCMGVRGDKF